MGDGTYYPPDVPAAWESGRRQGHLDKASEVAAAIAERDALRAEVEKLREALQDMASNGPCTCHEAHTRRGLVDPQCLADLWGDDAREALGEPIQCKGALSRRAALGDSKP